METVIFVILFCGIFALCILGYWIDNKYNMQLVKWLNMEVSSPFKKQVPPATQTNEYQQLRERIENLEKIVTDSRWELDQKLKNL